MPVDKIVLIAVMLIPYPYSDLRLNLENEPDSQVELLDENFRYDDNENYVPGPDGEEFKMSKEDFEDDAADQFYKNEFRGG